MLRLRLLRGGLLCLVRAPGALQLALIASRRPPYLRRWRVLAGPLVKLPVHDLPPAA